MHWFSNILLFSVTAANLKEGVCGERPRGQATAAQSTSDPYKVNSSAGTLPATPQPPPGSDLFNLSRDLYKLHWAKDTIHTLQAGLPMHEFNEAIENSLYGKIMQAIEYHLPLGQVGIGKVFGRLPESPIVEYDRDLKDDIQRGRRQVVEQKPIEDKPVELPNDPFTQMQELVKRVMQKQGVPTTAPGSTQEEAYEQWLASVNKKIKEVEGRIASAATLPEIPGRSAGLSIEIEKIMRDREKQAREINEEKIRKETLKRRPSEEPAADLLKRAREQSQARERSLQQVKEKTRETDRATLDAKQEMQELTISPHTAHPPPGWVPCQCPNQHVGAGLFVDGVQYHTPELHCAQ